MPSTTCGKEEPLPTREAGDWLPGKPFCPKRTRGKQSEHEPAAHSGSRDSQQQPTGAKTEPQAHCLSPFRCGLTPARSHLLWALQHKKNVDKLAQTQRRAARQGGLEQLPCEKRPRKQGQLSLETKWLWWATKLPVSTHGKGC